MSVYINIYLYEEIEREDVIGIPEITLKCSLFRLARNL